MAEDWKKHVEEVLGACSEHDQVVTTAKAPKAMEVLEDKRSAAVLTSPLTTASLAC